MTPPKGPNQRKKGEGSVYQRTANGRWYGAHSWTDNGERQRKTVSGATEEEAEQALEALRAEHSPVTIYLPKDLGEAAIAKAKHRKETLSNVVRPVIEDYVKE